MTLEEANEFLDNVAADDPLRALREFPQWLTPYRLHACALAEPAAALVHAFDLLTEEQRQTCAQAARGARLTTFTPDRLARRAALRLLRDRGWIWRAA